MKIPKTELPTRQNPNQAVTKQHVLFQAYDHMSQFAWSRLTWIYAMNVQ